METAWVHLTRLCGCNYQQPITRKGKSIFLADPQNSGQIYRLDAAKFDAGRPQFRGSWCIERWTDHAAGTVTAESDWQT